MPPLYSSIHSKRTVYRIALIKINLIIFKIIRKNRIYIKYVIFEIKKSVIDYILF